MGSEDLQMHPQHQNSTPVEETDWMSENHPKKPKTITPKKSWRKIKAREIYGFDIVSNALHIAEEINLFEQKTYQEVVSYPEAEE